MEKETGEEGKGERGRKSDVRWWRCGTELTIG